MKSYTYVASLLCLLLSAGVIKDLTHQLWRMRGAALLLGLGDTAFLAVTTPSETFMVLPTAGQPETRQYPGPVFSSISRDGKLVACVRLKSAKPQWAAAAIYSLPEKKWAEYAEAEYIEALSISPDNSKIALVTSVRDQVGIRIGIVDLVTRQQRLLLSPPPAGTVSWSPDGTRLAYDFFQGEFGTLPAINVVEVDTGKTWKIADGKGASWSPSGEWIAFFDVTDMSCMKVRPDGSGTSTMTPEHRDLFGWPRKFLLAPVWSPDSKKLLLNATWNVEDPSDILLFDIARQKLKKVQRHGVAVLGWAETK